MVCTSWCWLCCCPLLRQVMGASPGTGLFVGCPRFSHGVFPWSFPQINVNVLEKPSQKWCQSMDMDGKWWQLVQKRIKWEMNVCLKAIWTPGLQGFDPSAYVKVSWEEHEWNSIIQLPLRFGIGNPWLDKWILGNGLGTNCCTTDDKYIHISSNMYEMVSWSNCLTPFPNGCESKCKAPIHTNPQVIQTDPYVWISSADPYPNFNATANDHWIPQHWMQGYQYCPIQYYLDTRL